MRIEISESIRIDEAIRSDEAALAIGAPRFWVGRCEEPGVTLGVTQDPAVPPAENARHEGLPVYRRSSGGSALVHERGDLFWSVVLPRESRWVGRDYTRAYARLGAGWASALSSEGRRAAWVASSPTFPLHCFLSGRGSVLVCEDRALGGASQHLNARALLHHGTVTVVHNPGRVRSIFGMPALVQGQHLTSLEALGLEPMTRDLDALAHRLAEPFASRPPSGPIKSI
jgi:lipoate-protein ligase A